MRIPDKAIVSIIMPVHDFNQRKFTVIQNLVQLNNEPRCELIIVVNTRNSENLNGLSEILRNYPKSKVSLVEELSNKPGIMRNAGLKFINGKYVAFWDSDDVGNVSVLIKAAIEMDKSTSDCCICGYIVEDKNKNKIETRMETNLDSIGWNPGIWRIIFSVSSLENHQFDDLKMAEDQIFLLRYFSQFRKITQIFEPIYTYKKNFNSQTTKNEDALKDLSVAIEKISKLLNNYPTKLAWIMFFRIQVTLFKNRLWKNKIQFIILNYDILSTYKLNYIYELSKFLLNYLRNQMIR